jgi:uncharacterized protein (DUF3084 family)
MDRRFDAVDQRFETMDRRFDAVDQRFETMDRRFDAVDQRFETMDRRFDAVDQRFEAMDRRFDAVDQRVETMEGGLNTTLATGFSGVERKLEDFRRDLQRLSRMQEVASTRSALVALSRLPAGEVTPRGRPVPERANSWSPYTHRA